MQWNHFLLGECFVFYWSCNVMQQYEFTVGISFHVLHWHCKGNTLVSPLSTSWFHTSTYELSRVRGDNSHVHQLWEKCSLSNFFCFLSWSNVLFCCWNWEDKHFFHSSYELTFALPKFIFLYSFLKYEHGCIQGRQIMCPTRVFTTGVTKTKVFFDPAKRSH